MTTPTSARFDHTEGTVARSIEAQTAKLPSDAFLWTALLSMATSAALHCSGNKSVVNRVHISSITLINGVRHWMAAE